VGNNFPWHHPLRNTHPGGSSNHIFYLAYIITILLAHSKSVRIKICEIKYLKNATLCKTSNAVDPAKRGAKRTRIELAMLDFRPDEKRALPAHRASDRIDGIDRDFPFRDARLPSWAGQGSHHSSRPYILSILL
jgi:hypothetical protein